MSYLLNDYNCFVKSFGSAFSPWFSLRKTCGLSVEEKLVIRIVPSSRRESAYAYIRCMAEMCVLFALPCWGTKVSICHDS